MNDLDIAKLPLHLIDEARVKKSNLILVSATSPTPAGAHSTPKKFRK